ncbi:MAG: hypothetical protein D6805_10185 [Planctomycetota bacterium]|nr:MAG: hypothetical protein D6805_10185 [Planctomycetota bacterium]
MLKLTFVKNRCSRARTHWLRKISPFPQPIKKKNIQILPPSPLRGFPYLPIPLLPPNFHIKPFS